MSVKPNYLTPTNLQGEFDIPKHIIDSFLRLSDGVSLGRHIFNWCANIQYVDNAIYIGSGGSGPVFKLHDEYSMHQDSYLEDSEAIMVRSLLLKELAVQGVTIQVTPADRLKLRFDNDKYILTEESVGRVGPNWDWIQQADGLVFEIGNEQKLMDEIIYLLKHINNYSFEV